LLPGIPVWFAWLLVILLVTLHTLTRSFVYYGYVDSRLFTFTRFRVCPRLRYARFCARLFGLLRAGYVQHVTRSFRTVVTVTLLAAFALHTFTASFRLRLRWFYTPRFAVRLRSLVDHTRGFAHTFPHVAHAFTAHRALPLLIALVTHARYARLRITPRITLDCYALRFPYARSVYVVHIAVTVCWLVHVDADYGLRLPFTRCSAPVTPHTRTTRRCTTTRVLLRLRLRGCVRLYCSGCVYGCYAFCGTPFTLVYGRFCARRLFWFYCFTLGYVCVGPLLDLFTWFTRRFPVVCCQRYPDVIRYTTVCV